MGNIIRKIFYRILLFIDRKTDEAKNFYNLRTLTIGKGSALYKGTIIHNFEGNKKNIIIGDDCLIGGELITFNYGGKIEIGNNTFVGVGSRIWSGENVKIGSNVLVSHNVNIIDTDSHEIDHLERAEGYIKLMKGGYPKEKGNVKTKPIVIEDNVWINFNAVILKGVTIGKGAIVAAGAIVTKDVPEFCLVAGNPAQIIKKLDQK